MVEIRESAWASMHALSSVIDDVSQKGSFFRKILHLIRNEGGPCILQQNNVDRSQDHDQCGGSVLLKGSRDGRSVAKGSGRC